MCQSSSAMMKSNLVEGTSYQQAVVSQRVVLNIQTLLAGAGRSRQAVSGDLGVFTNIRSRGVRKGTRRLLLHKLTLLILQAKAF